MKGMRLLIAAVVLAGLAGFVYWSNKQEDKKTNKPDPKAPPKILDLKESDIKGIEIAHKGGETTVLSKDDAGQWRITAPKPLGADQTVIPPITSLVSGLNSDRVVDENVSDLSSYGLDPALIQVTLAMADGSKKVLRVGENTPTGNSAYAKVDGNNRLFTISTSSKTSLDKQTKDLRDKRLLTFDNDKISRIEFESSGKPPVEFGKAGPDWQILKPKTLRADGTAVDELVRKIKDSVMTGDDDPKASAASFGSGTRVASVKVTTGDGTQTLEIHKNKDDYFAKSSTLEGVYKVGKETGEAFNKSLDDFRNKKVFDFGFNDPTHIEYKDGGKSGAFDKSSDNWTSGGKTMDTVSVQNLIDKLRDLSATKFVDSGFGSPTLELSVVSNTSSDPNSPKRSEKIQIAPSGMNFVAKRENDASLYQIDGNAVSELRLALSGVKEPPPPAPASKDGKK